MAVSITAPNSRVVDRSGCVQVTWMPGYPQSAYEILYRRKGEESWNTFGRVESTANSVELDLSVFEDFTEYHYRVICYSDDTENGDTIYSGSDSSAAYSLIVTPTSRLAAMRIRYGSEMAEIPVYDETATGTSIKVAMPSGVQGIVPIGGTDNALASELRVEVGGEVRAALGGKASFVDSGVKAGAYMTIKERYSYSYANPSYTYSYQYSYTNPTYTYYYRYSWTNPTYTYYSRYSYTNPTYYYAATGTYYTPKYYSKYSYTTYSLHYTKPSYSYQTAAARYAYTSYYVYSYLSSTLNGYYAYRTSYLYSYRTSYLNGQNNWVYETQYSYKYRTEYAATYKYYSVYAYRGMVHYTPATYGYGYYYTKYYSTATQYGYKVLGNTPVSYQYSTSGGGGTSYGYHSNTGGGGTRYGYRSSTGGGGTSYGYRYTEGDGGSGTGYGYSTTFRYE